MRPCREGMAWISIMRVIPVLWGHDLRCVERQNYHRLLVVHGVQRPGFIAHALVRLTVANAQGRVISHPVLVVARDSADCFPVTVSSAIVDGAFLPFNHLRPAGIRPAACGCKRCRNIACDLLVVDVTTKCYRRSINRVQRVALILTPTFSVASGCVGTVDGVALETENRVSALTAAAIA